MRAAVRTFTAICPVVAIGADGTLYTGPTVITFTGAVAVSAFIAGTMFPAKAGPAVGAPEAGLTGRVVGILVVFVKFRRNFLPFVVVHDKTAAKQDSR